VSLAIALVAAALLVLVAPVAFRGLEVLARRRIQERARLALADRIGAADVHRVVERDPAPWALHPLAATGLVFARDGHAFYARRRLTLGLFARGALDVQELAPDRSRVASVGNVHGSSLTWVELEVDGAESLILGPDAGTITWIGHASAARELVHALASALPRAPGVDDREEPPIEYPILIVDRRVPGWIADVQWPILIGYASALGAVAVVVVRDGIPRLRLLPWITALAPGALLAAAAIVARAWIRARHARVAFFQDRISIRRGTSIVIRWTSLEGFWDGNSDYVRLAR
jgi:hypothetical protein